MTLTRISTQTASWLLGLVALGVPAWWAILYRSPRVRDWFIPAPEWNAFQMLLLPDLALALLTGAAAVVIRMEQRPVGLLACAAGAWGYATLYTLSWMSRTAAPYTGLWVISVVFVIIVMAAYTVAASPQSRPKARTDARHSRRA